MLKIRDCPGDSGTVGAYVNTVFFSNYSATLILAPGLHFNYSFAPIERQIQIGIFFPGA